MFEFDIQSVTDWQRQRHGTRSDVGLYVLAIGSGARGLSVSRDSACEEWRHRLYSLVMTGWCVWTVNWEVRVAECTATGWLLSVDCWQALHDLLLLGCCCARISAITYIQRLFIYWIPNNINKLQCFILFKYQKLEKIIEFSTNFYSANSQPLVDYFFRGRLIFVVD